MHVGRVYAFDISVATRYIHLAMFAKFRRTIIKKLAKFALYIFILWEYQEDACNTVYFQRDLAFFVPFALHLFYPRDTRLKTTSVK